MAQDLSRGWLEREGSEEACSLPSRGLLPAARLQQQTRSQPPWLGSNDKRVQLGNAKAYWLHQSIRSRMRKTCCKDSQFLLEEDTDAPSEVEVFLSQKVSRLALKLKILLHQLVLCCVQSLRSFCSNSFCGKTQWNRCTGLRGTHFNTLSFPPRKLPLSHYPPDFLTKVLSSALKAFGSQPPYLPPQPHSHEQPMCLVIVPAFAHAVPSAGNALPFLLCGLLLLLLQFLPPFRTSCLSYPAYWVLSPCCCPATPPGNSCQPPSSSQG